MQGSVREVLADEPALIPGLCRLLQDSVDGGASVGFLAPLSEEKATSYWLEVFDQLPGTLRLWVYESDGIVSGSIQIVPCQAENARHRAELRKLFVYSSQRGKGIAGALLERVEADALAAGNWLLVLDTLEGSGVETLYLHLGWTRVGAVPDFAATTDGILKPTVYFYKNLAPAGQ